MRDGFRVFRIVFGAACLLGGSWLLCRQLLGADVLTPRKVELGVVFSLIGGITLWHGIARS